MAPICKDPSGCHVASHWHRVSLDAGVLGTWEVRGPGKSAAGDRTVFQKGQAPHRHWMRQRPSGTAGASGSKDRDSLSPLCAPRSGGDWVVSGKVGSQGALEVWATAQRPNGTLNSRLGKKRPPMKLRTV